MRKRERLVHIRLTDEEEEIIKKLAEKDGKKVIPYMRMAALNPVIYQIDYSPIAEHTKEISELRNTINQIIFTIEATNNYLPREIDTIVECMNKIWKSENKLLEELREQRQKLYKQTSKSEKKKNKRKDE